MKKLLLLFLMPALLVSCTSQKKILDTWLGHPKQEIIMKWGPPAKTAEDGNNGQVLIYAHQVYIPQYNLNYWDYTMMYVNTEGKIYHWRTSRENIPPTQIVISRY